jgi:tetratricopeptide (TPR) repeat protein
MNVKRPGQALIFIGAVLFFFVAHSGSARAKGSESGKEKLRALNAQIIEADEKQDLPAALLAAEEAVRVAQEVFGPESLETADAMTNVANLYMVADRAPEAARMYQRAILIELEKRDNESVEMADSYMNLGAAYAVQKKYTAAIDILNKAVNIRLKKLGPDDPSTKQVREMAEDVRKLAYPETEIL